MKDSGYNERLFRSGLRKYLHMARFYWCAEEIKRLKCPLESVLELGCFDGKTIQFLPKKPEKYRGFDANWEGGLDLAASKWKSHHSYSFHKSSTPEEMSIESNETFDTALILETLEHVPPSLVSPYLKKIAGHLKGHLFITVPNEMGPVFLAKWIAKKLVVGDAEEFSFKELVNATLWRTHGVQRREHKGFDYRLLIEEISDYFQILHVSGYPFRFLPMFLNFGVGIAAKSKT